MIEVTAAPSTLTVRNLASGKGTTVFSATPGIDATKINDIVWAPDGKSLVFTAPDSAGRPTLQVVNADGTGLKQLLVGRFTFAGGAALAQSPWQPVWPQRGGDPRRGQRHAPAVHCLRSLVRRHSSAWSPPKRSAASSTGG